MSINFKRSLLTFCLSSLSLTSVADITNGDMLISPLTENVYQHVSFNQWQGKFTPSNGIVLVVENDAYIIDTPWLKKDTEKLVEWINNQGFKLKASLSTHFHDDRSSGIEYLNSLGIKTVASKLTNDLLGKESKAQAKVSFAGNQYVLLDKHIEAFYPGAGHSMDNIVVWLGKQKILIGGCLIRSQASQGMGYTADGSIADWANSVRKVQQQYPQAKIVVPGHGKIGDQVLLSHTIKIAEKARVKNQP